MLRSLQLVLNHPFNRGRPIAAMWRVLKWQVTSRLASRPLGIRWIDDKCFIARNGMTGATGNIYCGFHEFQEMGFLLHYLRPGDLFVDVGANVGSYSILASAAGAEVIAYEPGERHGDLVANFQANGIVGVCRNVAVGERAGKVKFTVGRDCINRISESGEPAIEVAVVALDADLPRVPVAIKVDVEGFEHPVFAGGSKSIAAAQVLIIELSDQRLFPRLREWGFKHVDYDPERRVLLPPTERHNTIWVKGDALDRLKSSPYRQVLDRRL